MGTLIGVMVVCVCVCVCVAYNNYVHVESLKGVCWLSRDCFCLFVCLFVCGILLFPSPSLLLLQGCCKIVRVLLDLGLLDSEEQQRLQPSAKKLQWVSLFFVFVFCFLGGGAGGE